MTTYIDNFNSKNWKTIDCRTPIQGDYFISYDIDTNELSVYFLITEHSYMNPEVIVKPKPGYNVPNKQIEPLNNILCDNNEIHNIVNENIVSLTLKINEIVNAVNDINNKFSSVQGRN